MNRILIGAVGVLALIALPACGGGSYNAWAESPAPQAMAAAGPTAFYAPGAAESDDMGGEMQYAGRSFDGDADRASAGSGGAPPSEQPRYAQAEPPEGQARTVSDAREGPLLIYTASISLAVHQVSEKQGRIEVLATEAGGHLHHRGDMEITIRVPSESFQQVLAAILELGDVLSRDVSVQDVSEEFHDVETRIRTLEAMYARVQQLLAHANDVDHALAVEQHLERITLELERLRGRLRFLADQVSLSTITVRFTEQATVTEPRFELPFAWLRALGLPNLMRLR